ncbi:anaphase-promoting complex, cyclosome, subunit 3-domain-containing protein [Cryomyces antarcticus]
MEQFLREWRQDALNKHQYESAIFVGDKLLALTNNERDVFWLAQVHFSAGNYSRALSFLARTDLPTRNPSCRYLAAHCHVKQGRYDDALAILGDRNPVHLITTSNNARRKLQHVDGTVRGGVGRGSKGTLRGGRADRSEERDGEDVSNIKFEAGMCYLRGVCYAKQNAFDRAKECYKDAVLIDVQCFEAFDQLMKNSLMSPDEEWKFLESLNFDSVSGTPSASSTQEAADFTRLLYTTRLSKYEHPDEFARATETLSTHYNLAANPDILLSRAELLFTQCRFRAALTLTTSILEADPCNFSAIPIHLAALHELDERNALFLLSHDLADKHPEEPCAWLAIGVYYLTIHRIADARRFFSKASMMDPHFGPAWIGFAHTFAAEGEHDQAISAYSTAARLFQGTHLPQLFLGMQNLQLHNLGLAHEYISTAYDLCRSDPLLLNELGVVFFHEACFDEAIRVFTLALEIGGREASSSTPPPASASAGAATAGMPPATSTTASSSAILPYTSLPSTHLPTLTNLAHALRRTHPPQLTAALTHFDTVLRLGGPDAAVLAAKALVLLDLDREWEAVAALHEALAVRPQDAVAGELLRAVLERGTVGGGARNEGEYFGLGGRGDGEVYGGLADEEVDRRIGKAFRDAGARRRRGGAGRVRRSTGAEDGGESMVVDEAE